MRSVAIFFAGEASRAGGVRMTAQESVSVQVNGEKRELLWGTTVGQLLEQLGLNPARVAIEYNLAILPKGKWEQTRMTTGDKLEIVQFVGGG